MILNLSSHSPAALTNALKAIASYTLVEMIAVCVVCPRGSNSDPNISPLLYKRTRYKDAEDASIADAAERACRNRFRPAWGCPEDVVSKVDYSPLHER